MARTTLHWINCRSSVGYVTDGTNQIVLPTSGGGNLQAYPYEVTVAGYTFDVGWNSSADGARDRSAAVDPRCAGAHLRDNTGTQRILRIDLSEGLDINLHLALGQAGFATAQYVQVMDDSSVLETIDLTGSPTTSGQFYDTNGTLHTSAANWVTNQTGKQYTISSGILQLRIGTPTNVGGTSAIASVGIQEIEPVSGNANLLVGKFGALLKGKLA